MKMITISGVDGSGKSTQVELLTKHLEATGARVYYFHAVQFSIANKGKNAIGTPGEKKAVTHASWYKIQLRKAALVIDIMRFESLVQQCKKDGYTHMVSDRYFYDSLLNILYLSDSKLWSSFGVGLLAKIVHVPDYLLYLRVAPETVAARERTVEQGSDYTLEKIALFDRVAPHWGLETVSGEGDVSTVSAQITKALE